MKTYNNIYHKIYDLGNLQLAYKKAKKGKSKKYYVISFEKDLKNNILHLQKELKNLTYKPKPLKTFILRDPKTRKISISDFRDRIIHHAVYNIIGPIFDKTFIYDSYANRKGKGNLKALERFHCFMKKVSRNGKVVGQFNNNQIKGYCLKCDIRRYFFEINHIILLRIIRKKINDKNVLWLIEQILSNNLTENIGMPLGNLTSQLFANVYLNELDRFVKHHLKAKFYIRYVDDFVILHPSKSQLQLWKYEINKFLKSELKIKLHNQKSRIIPLARGVDFVGFRNFYYFRLLRKRNIKKMFLKVRDYKDNKLSSEKIYEIHQGWNAYARWANTYKLRLRIAKSIKRKSVE